MGKYKVLGHMVLFYGREYLKESLLSIKDHVDLMHIAYTRTPSQGFTTELPCPDSANDMREIALEVLGGKLVWENYEGFHMEASHRNTRYKYADSFSHILIIDADEVLKEDTVDGALEFAYENKQRYYGVNGFINFWRSFSWCCRDEFRPIRIEKVNSNNQDQNLNCEMGVYHFSLCQNSEIIEFKFKIFGHRDELRENYLRDIYYAWTPEKKDEILLLHPTTTGIWGKAEPFDKTTLPSYLKKHPNYKKELV